MYSLGMFVFELNTAPFQDMQQSLSWRHPSTSVVGARPPRQFVGPDEDSISLSGYLVPEITGMEQPLSSLRAMADKGDAYPLISGTGEIKGLFVIESMKVGRTLFFDNGLARRIEFSIDLKRADNDRIDHAGVGSWI